MMLSKEAFGNLFMDYEFALYTLLDGMRTPGSASEKPLIQHDASVTPPNNNHGDRTPTTIR